MAPVGQFSMHLATLHCLQTMGIRMIGWG